MNSGKKFIHAGISRGMPRHEVWVYIKAYILEDDSMFYLKCKKDDCTELKNIDCWLF